MMPVIGIDPGVTGAVAVITDDRVEVYDMPVMATGTGFVKRAVNAEGLSTLLAYPSLLSGEKTVVCLEQVNAFPGQGVASMFSLGHSFGVVLGVCAGKYLEVHLVRPAAWKAHFGLSRDKGASLEVARRMFPGAELHLAKHHNRAEALLIAAYGKHLEGK